MRIASLSAAALTMTCFASWFSPSGGYAQDPTGEPPAPGEEGAEDLPVEVDLVDQSIWVEPGEDFDMTFEIDPGDGDLPADTNVSVIVYPPLTTRHFFNETLLGLVGPSQQSNPVNSSLGEIERTRDGNLRLAFETGPSGAGLTEQGVYPLEVRLTSPEGDLLGQMITHLLRQPEAEFAPLDVAVIVEMGAPPAQQPEGTIDLPDGQLDLLRDRTELLEATDDRLSVAPVPETLDSLARLDESTTEGLLDDLGSALGEHEILSGPYVTLDLESWAAAGLVPEVTTQAERGASVLRDDLDLEPVPSIWLTGTSVGQAEATAWRDLGIFQAILPGGAVAEIQGEPDSIAPLVELPDGPSGFVSDDVLVDRLLSVEDPLDQQRLIAELAMIWLERPGESRAVVLRLPSDRTLDPETVAETLDMMSPSLSVIGATELFSAHGPGETRPPTPVTLDAKEADDLNWMPSRLERAEQTIDSLGALLDSDELDSLRRSLLIAPGIQTEDRRAYIDRVDQAQSGVADAINAPDEFVITLTDRNGVIPLTISNELDEEVPVRVQLKSNQLEFEDSEDFEVDVPPGSTRFDVRVRTRTSGAFPLRVTLTSPDGTVTLDETTFDIRSTAISGVGLFLSIGAGLFLVIWWARHWLRTRRTRAAQPADSPSSAS